MNYDFSFYMPVNIIGGSNVLQDNKNVFSQFGKKCLIVTGASSAKKSGALDDVVAILDELSIEYSIFDAITENPLTTTCCEGGKVAREFSADYIIGIGGGSPLDASKAVCVYATNPQILDDGIYTEKVENEPLPLIVIGTTSGTGSEVSGVSVLTRKDGRKQSVGGKNYYAPIQRVEDFINNVESTYIGSVKPSYKPGYTLSNLNKILYLFSIVLGIAAITMLFGRSWKTVSSSRAAPLPMWMWLPARPSMPKAGWT